METLKRIGLKLLYPHVIIIAILFPISIALMICAMIFLGSESVLSIISYVLSAYSLTVVCFRIPDLIKFFKIFKNNNKYYLRWVNDIQLRMNILLYATVLLNIIYSIFQFVLGLYHKSFWFLSMAVYYVLLAVMRYYLANYTKKYKPQEKIELELKKYRLCGWLLLLMNIAVIVIIFFIIYWNRTFYHHQITTIALAAYTFIMLTLSIINFIKYRKYKSPVYSAAKTINLISASVSMMTLTTTMLTTFGGEDIVEFKQIILFFVGVIVSLFILLMAINMIINSSKMTKEMLVKEEGLSV